MSTPHRFNILWSYAYLKNDRSYDVIQQLGTCANVLIDCGAFTAWMTGKEITIDEYIKVCKQRLHGKVWQYIALDKIRVPAETRTNLQKMLDAGLTPMPVWVEGMDENEIPGLVDINEHICVPGGTKSSDDFIYHRIQTAHKVTNGRAKSHALGFLRFPDIFRLPLFSGDSSTFSNGSRFGVFARFSPDKGVVGMRLDQVRKSPEFLQHMLKCSVPKDHLYSEKLHTGGASFLTFNTVFAHVKYSQFCLAKGFRYFWAVPDVAWLNRICSVLNSYQNTHFNFVECLNTFNTLQDMAKNWETNSGRYLATIAAMVRKY